MTRKEIMKKWIWPSRLIFQSSLLFGKPYKSLTEDEEYEVRKVILEQQAEREAKDEELREHYKKHGYGNYYGQ